MNGPAIEPRPVAKAVQTEVSDAFRAQMVALIPSLRAFARGLCGNRELADDLAQEAMMRACGLRMRALHPARISVHGCS